MSDHINILKEELKAGLAQLVDVREQEEWDAGSLVEAKLIPLSELNQGQLREELDQDKKIYLHCRSGRRVYMAAPILESMGFREVIPLSEGFRELCELGFESK